MHLWDQIDEKTVPTAVDVVELEARPQINVGATGVLPWHGRRAVAEAAMLREDSLLLRLVGPETGPPTRIPSFYGSTPKPTECSSRAPRSIVAVGDVALAEVLSWPRRRGWQNPPPVCDAYQELDDFAGDAVIVDGGRPGLGCAGKR